MSEPTPHHSTNTHSDTQQPTADSTEPSQVDFVAGDPPVPITVWRTARTPADAGRQIGARLAARLIAAYSRPGDEVVDLTPRHTLAAACTVGGRAHLPAWFTEASSLIIGPTTPVTPTSTEAARPQAEPRRGRRGRNRDEESEAPELSTWFGDDLTDPDLPGSHPTTDTQPANITTRMTGLVVTCWPLHEQEAANRIRLAWLLTVCARLLRPGGCLILVVTVPPGTVATPEDFTPMVQAAAAGAGLGYLQHIVAVHATIGTHNDTDNDGDDGDGGDAFVYHVTDEELLTLASTTGHGWALAHLRVHADLLVFSRTHTADRDSSGARAGKESGRRA